MKKILLLIAATVMLCACSAPAEKGAYEVLRRTFGHVPANLRLKLVEKADSCDFYAWTVRGNVLTVEGSSTVAICKGFHDYIVDKGYGIASWSGNRLDFPSVLEPMERTVNGSPFQHHLYFNVCTFGYTTPFWSWDRWQQEIDLLALHGFDMLLSPIGYEAIARRVFMNEGLSEAQVKEYFCGPAHMAWSRMGNLSGIDGGMDDKWYDNQIRLEHRILSRMRELGMDPIIQGFAGFVPDAMTQLHPDCDYTRTEWHTLGATYVSPVDSLCKALSSSFVREWEREFGRCDYYLIDSFNEMQLPFAPIGEQARYDDLNRYASAIYDGLHEANPEAVWVMQGWMFGRNRDIWEPRSVQALLNCVPHGKLMVVDLAVDFNEYVWKNGNNWDVFDGFFGTDWIWSTTPNFGGRNTMKGVLDFYLNGHLSALSSANKGSLVGYGCSPEGIEANEPLLECVSSAGWSSAHKDIKGFLMKYSRARYGMDIEGASLFWDGLLESLYNNFCGNDVLQWQRLPAHHFHSAMNINEHFFEAVEAFFENAEKKSGSKLYCTDAVYYGAMYLVLKAEVLFHNCVIRMGMGNSDELRAMQDTVLELLLAADRLLESHPLYRLERWQQFARNAAASSDEADAFEAESRRLVTTWGGYGICDYSARIWSGLIRDYYVPRLKLYFDSAANGEYTDMLAYSDEFRKHNEISACEPFGDALAAADSLVRRYSKLKAEEPSPYREYWCSVEFPDGAGRMIDCYISDKDARGLKALRFTAAKGNPKVDKVVIRNRWDGAREFYPNMTLREEYSADLRVNMPAGGIQGMGSIVYMDITYSDAEGSCGTIDFVY